MKWMMTMQITRDDIIEFKNDLTLHTKDINLIDKAFIKNKPSISFLIIVKNGERTIQRCIKSILKYCDDTDEIKIIDTGSEDRTLEIINSFKDKKLRKFDFEWEDDFSKVRNYAKSLAKKEWIFFIDADEYLDEGSVIKLKKYICILKQISKNYIFINPTIVNTNDHIIHGVSRIFENNKKVTYKGLVHEYPYIPNEKIDVYSFESILLHHDGYDSRVIDMESKINRNIKLLNKMKSMENNIRWDYLYCRDGSYIWDDSITIRNLEKLVIKWKHEKHSDAYYSAVRDLIELYLNNGNLVYAKKYLKFLKTLDTNESDVFYFDSLISWFELKSQEKLLLDKTINYRQTRKEIDYGALHSNYYHIDYLISQIMLSQGELENGFKIQKKLNDKGIFNFTINFDQIHKIISNMNEV
ncbi:hypothetical protein B8W90_09485 [Staphylococcus hominis]|nr:hypothetical protein B8W90_09485 [Staphylococcus hominis]